MSETTTDIDAALEALTLEEKVLLLTGRDFWSTWPLERIGLRSMVLSDGPSGVRGAAWDERDPSLNLPSGSALAASWDPDIARRYGAAAAVEARRKGVARALMEAGLAAARQAGAGACFLEVAIDNPAAIALYERLGFSRAGLRRGYYDRGEAGRRGAARAVGAAGIRLLGGSTMCNHR